MVVNEPKPGKNWLSKRGAWYLGDYVGGGLPLPMLTRGNPWEQGGDRGGVRV